MTEEGTRRKYIKIQDGEYSIDEWLWLEVQKQYYIELSDLSTLPEERLKNHNLAMECKHKQFEIAQGLNKE